MHIIAVRPRFHDIAEATLLETVRLTSTSRNLWALSSIRLKPFAFMVSNIA